MDTEEKQQEIDLLIRELRQLSMEEPPAEVLTPIPPEEELPEEEEAPKGWRKEKRRLKKERRRKKKGELEEENAPDIAPTPREEEQREAEQEKPHSEEIKSEQERRIPEEVEPEQESAIPEETGTEEEELHPEEIKPEQENTVPEENKTRKGRRTPKGKKPKKEKTASRERKAKGEAEVQERMRRLRTRRRWIWIGAVATVLLLSVLLIVLFFLHKPIESIAFAQEQQVLKVGESCTPDFVYGPLDATQTELRWKSSNRSVATVQAGVITAVGEGECYISVTAESGVKDSFRLKVEAPLTLQEAKLCGPWRIYALVHEDALQYLYTDRITLSLTESRTGELCYQGDTYLLEDWRCTEQTADYDLYTLRFGEEEREMYYCKDVGTAYQNCLLIVWEEDMYLLFQLDSTQPEE